MNPVIIGQATLYHADCIEVMAGLAENSLDAIICDPPYLINFMNKGFDTQHKSLPGANEGQKMQEWHRRWVTEAYRILKPGGHLAAFGGDRTHHRLMSAMEDVGFEIRFNCYWIFSTGFPKSQDAAKAIENRRASNNVIRPWLRSLGTIEEIAIAAGVTNRQVDHWLGENTPCPQTLTYKRFVMLCNHFGKVPEWADSIIPKVGNKIGEITHARSGGDDFAKRPGSLSQNKTVDLRDIVSPEAKQWSGYGTALKPSVEPICVGRKPMIGTLAENLLTWGCGAMNLDASRVETNDSLNGGAYSNGTKDLSNASSYATGINIGEFKQPIGRFPPHLLHDGSDVVKQCFPESGPSGWRKTGKTALGQSSGWNKHENKELDCVQYNESGSASRFFPSLPYDEEDCATIFYCAKASKCDRDDGCEMIESKSVENRNIFSSLPNPRMDHEQQRLPSRNHHVSVKPTNLMRWLCRLLTPKGGMLLDPFMGSGSTLKAAVLENFSCIGIERDEDYFAIAEARVAHVSPEIVEVKRTERSVPMKQQASLF